MWLISGTLPAPLAELPLEYGVCQPVGATSGGGMRLRLPSGREVPVERGTACLVAATTLACHEAGLEPPCACLAGDTGKGDGSRAIYAHLCDALNAIPAGDAPHELAVCRGMTFHYLFPDVDWHNRVLMTAQAHAPQAQLVADAGFMYVAKMSGYADAYTLFTPDVGEMAFLADEKAPHPFYTRGFLLAEEADIPELARRAAAHGNCPRHLLVKGATDYIIRDATVLEAISSPGEPAMEAVGGTGDLVTALVTVGLMAGLPPVRAARNAALAARHIAHAARPTPATHIDELLPHITAFVPTLLRD